MADDSKYVRAGAVVGSGRVRGFQNKYFQRVEGGAQHINDLGLQDISPDLLRIGSRAGEQIRLRRKKKDVVYDQPISMAQAKVQAPDMESYTFDMQTIPPPGAVNNVAAGAVQFQLLTVNISQGIQAVLKRFGWYTNAAGSAFLQFGLYIGDELVAPGGKYIGDQPRPITQYNPSGTSTSFVDLAQTHIPINPDNNARILVTNLDPANAYPAWARLWGWHWEEQLREAGGRAYYNEKLDKISS